METSGGSAPTGQRRPPARSGITPADAEAATAAPHLPSAASAHPGGAQRLFALPGRLRPRRAPRLGRGHRLARIRRQRGRRPQRRRAEGAVPAPARGFARSAARSAAALRDGHRRAGRPARRGRARCRHVDCVLPSASSHRAFSRPRRRNIDTPVSASAGRHDLRLHRARSRRDLPTTWARRRVSSWAQTAQVRPDPPARRAAPPSRSAPSVFSAANGWARLM